MTISYAGSFVALLARWKGSMWKTVYRELLVWLVGYYVIKVVYMFAMKDAQK